MDILIFMGGFFISALPLILFFGIIFKDTLKERK